MAVMTLRVRERVMSATRRTLSSFVTADRQRQDGPELLRRDNDPFVRRQTDTYLL